MTRLASLVIALLLLGCGPDDNAPDLRIAVAANFAAPLRQLVDDYCNAAGLPPTAIAVSVGATGSLAQQIRQGAPFDLFLAADRRRPTTLAKEGHGQPDSQRSYAIGRLVLVSNTADLIAGAAVLATSDARLVIANPTTAPYGLAAQETLASLGHWARWEGRLIRAQSAGQAQQMIASGAVAGGFIAQAQLTGMDIRSHWLVPSEHHHPIEQHGLLLSASPTAAAFWRWLTEDPQARATIAAAGYDLQALPGQP